jgi:hypothetical protein
MSMLSACASPTVTYFPVRHDSEMSLLMPLYGKIELNEGILRLKEIGTDNSYALIWPGGYSYHVSGGSVEIADENGNIVAKTGQYKLLGGSPEYSIEYYTGGKPPMPVPGPVFAIDKGAIKNLYPWDYIVWPVLVGITLAILTASTLIVWLIMRRRTIR